MRRDLVWEMLPAIGLEHLAIEIETDGVVAEGIVAADFGEGGFRLRYSVRCDGDWRFVAAMLSVDRAGARRALEITHDEAGAWRVDGAPRPDLSGCIDIDIMASPLTNTLPVRRLDFAEGLPRRIAVAYIRVPDLSVTRQEQEYTLLGRGAAGRRFRYHGLESGFVAEVEVDGDGLVADYGDIWRRRAG
jgi:hypothetical protein